MELNKSLLDCMRAVRRRLREEQALDIHFQQRDAVAAMQAACARSGDATTRELGQRLGRLSGVALPLAEPSCCPRRRRADNTPARCAADQSPWARHQAQNSSSAVHRLTRGS